MLLSSNCRLRPFFVCRCNHKNVFIPLHISTGLIELPHAIDLNGSIRPAILPSNCNEFSEEERVISAGNGRINAYLPANDRILRHGYSQIMYEDECASESDDADPDSIICAYALNGQNVFSGDSGIFNMETIFALRVSLRKNLKFYLKVDH